MGALICSKISAKKATLFIVVTALVFLYTFIFAEFERIFRSDGLEFSNSTAVTRRSGSTLHLEEISALSKRRAIYASRRLLLAGTKTRHELKTKIQFYAANIRDLGTHRVGRSVVLSTSRRFLADNMCSNKDISIIQSEEPNSGIPRYVVQIVNTCLSDCAPSEIHVFCGWFASSPLVNPNTFRRLAYNDCLVNGGRPLSPGECGPNVPVLSWIPSSLTYICSDKDISITQSRDGTTGIPLYSVQITNTCMSDCAPSDIHINCGWFASSPPPNPNVFKRLAYNDCLVNGGKPLPQGNIIQFQYANSFMYPLSFKSAKFCRN